MRWYTYRNKFIMFWEHKCTRVVLFLRLKISYPFEFKVLVVVKQPSHSNLTGHDYVGADNHKLSPNIERVAIGISQKGYRKIDI